MVRAHVQDGERESLGQATWLPAAPPPTPHARTARGGQVGNTSSSFCSLASSNRLFPSRPDWLLDSQHTTEPGLSPRDPSSLLVASVTPALYLS